MLKCARRLSDTHLQTRFVEDLRLDERVSTPCLCADTSAVPRTVVSPSTGGLIALLSNREFAKADQQTGSSDRSMLPQLPPLRRRSFPCRPLLQRRALLWTCWMCQGRQGIHNQVGRQSRLCHTGNTTARDCQAVVHVRSVDLRRGCALFLTPAGPAKS